MTRPEDTAAPPRPRVSVIVTNHDYGHFLGACLASLSAQTSPPDEIVVVDDGSTDGSRRILEAEAGITAIFQENRGQAGAFNAGFAASTGDAVLFLDADDVLDPDAVATIRALWTGAVAGLSWSLDTIDAAGARTGRYPKAVPDTDMRPRLLDGLTMPFMPTSANVFARDAIAWAFPLPEARWRISADALLVRAAVLAGPMRPLARTLGGYRVHGDNNYHRGEDTRTANLYRGLRDIACAGLDLLERADRAGRLAGDGERAKLLAGAVRARLRAEAIAPDPAGFREFVARLPGAARGAGPRLSSLARLAAILLPRSDALRRAAVDPALRPRLLQEILERCAGPRLSAARYAPVERRAPWDGPPHRHAAEGPLPLGDLLDDPAWERDWSDGSYRLRAARGGFSLARPPGVASELRLSLRPVGAGEPILRLSCNGLPLAAHHLHAATDLVVPLPPAPAGCWRSDRLEIAVEDPAHRRRAWTRRRDPAARLALCELRIAPVAAPGPDAVLPVVGEAPVSVPEGFAQGAPLRLALPALPPPFALVLRLGAAQAPGRLILGIEGERVFSGRVGPGTRLVVDLPGHLAGLPRIALVPGFRPDAFLDGSELAVEAAGWLSGRAGGEAAAVALAPGERIGAGAVRGLGAVLEPGWEADAAGGATMTGPSAELTLRPLLPGGTGMLALDIEPLDPMAEDDPPVVLVTVGGEERARVRLAGRSTLEVAVAAEERTEAGLVHVALHAALPDETGAAQADHGGLVLHGLALAAAPEPGAFVPPPAPVPDASPLVRHLARLREEAGLGLAGADLPALRTALADALGATAPRAVWHLLAPADLGHLAALAARLGPVAEPPRAPPAAGEGWLRDVALAALSAPVPPALAAMSLPMVPHLPADLARAVAALLVRDPGPGAPRETLLAHQAALVSRLGEARDILADAPLGSARGAFARAVLEATDPRGLLFSDLDLAPHASAFARALEAMLLREGHALDLPPATRAPGRPRIGLLLRHAGPSPETWIARGIVGALPPGRAEVTVFLTQERDGAAEDLGSARVVPLGGRTVADAVSVIRAAGLDTMLLCAAFHGAMRETGIAAHRLAPRQVALAAALPATSGLTSVDEVLIGTLEATEEGARDYAERVVRTPGTGQLFEFGADAPPEAGARDRMRRRLGLGEDAVLMTSGAMADKIGPELLDAWCDILRRRPEAVLVLYPFPASWQRAYDQAGFAASVRAACLGGGIDPARVILLPPLGAEGVGVLLAAADLYLAAFPYSGATTTLEALRAGLPVVARAERTQRGHQAAGWLEAFGQARLVAADTAGYVRVAAGLCGDARKRAAASQAIRAAAPGAMAQAPLAAWLAGYLLPPEAGAAHRYLFHHIPKTGGTSLGKVISNWFEIVEDYYLWGEPRRNPIDIDSIGQHQAIIGHYWAPEFSLHLRYPEVTVSTEWRLVAFVREPLETALSDYFYEIRERERHDATFQSRPLDEYLSERRNYFLRQFSVTKSDWPEVLDRYWFIGTLERFRDCVDWLADSMGMPRPEVLPVENATDRSEEPSPAAVAAFMANNAADYALYDEVNRRLDRLIGPARD